MIGAVATRHALALPQWSCDPLARPQFGFAIAGLSLIGRIAQQPPYCRALPTRHPGPRRNLALIQHASDGVDTQPLSRVNLKHHPYDSSLGFDDLVIGRRTVALAHVSIPVGSAHARFCERLGVQIPRADSAAISDGRPYRVKLGSVASTPGWPPDAALSRRSSPAKNDAERSV